MNKKGFTLIEVLAAIAIVFLLSTLVISNMFSVDQDVKQQNYENLVKEILLSAQDYANSQGSVLNEIYTSANNVDSDSKCICNASKPKVKLTTLIDKGFIRGNDKTKENLVDPRDNSNMGEMYVVFCHTGEFLKTEFCETL